MKLSASALADLPESVDAPSYDRSAVTTGIVHFGIGGFHRAHEAMFIDRILASGATAWGITGVGVLDGDRDMFADLRAQDGLYSLTTTDPSGHTETRVIGSILTAIHAGDDPAAVADLLDSPEVRIVSLTVTEGGYPVDLTTRTFEPRDDQTRADASGAQPPRSAWGLIVSALRRRRDSGMPPFTVLSCDNITGNGDVARIATVGLARSIDPALASWIESSVSFPNSMVDRITPVTTELTRTEAAAALGVIDARPVHAESFAQWVLEDDFPTGRPPLEDVGVHLVQDAAPYELMKLRLLNASHQAMAHLGILAGHTLVHETCREPLFRDFLLQYMRGEATPTLAPVPGIDLDRYQHTLLERFGSEAIRDTLARQVVDSSDRIPTFLLPVVRDQLATGGDIRCAALIIAAWSLCLAGLTEAGDEITIVDRRESAVRAAAAREQDEPGAFLDFADVFDDLGTDTRFRQAYLDARAELRTAGTRATITRLLSELSD